MNENVRRALRHIAPIVERALVQSGMDGGDDDPPEPDFGKLKGYPGYGDRLRIVWDARYEGWEAHEDEPPTYEDDGYLMGLPGLDEDDPEMGGIVHVPSPNNEGGKGAADAQWITMFDLLLLPDVLRVEVVDQCAEQQPDAPRCGGCGTEIDARCEDCRNAIRCEGCGQRIEDDEYDVWEDGVYTHKGDCPPSGENDALPADALWELETLLSPPLILATDDATAVAAWYDAGIRRAIAALRTPSTPPQPMSDAERARLRAQFGPSAAMTIEDERASVPPSAALPVERCAWSQDEDIGVWNTQCGEAHVFTAEGPRENRHRFCPYCGRVLATLQSPATQPSEEE